ncbi:hypothetical protein VUN82_09710 [Micrococcaceae bacterium Sec5.1]
MADVADPEPFRARFDILTAVIESLQRLKGHASKLVPVIKDDDQIDLVSVDLVIDAWLTVLEDDYILVGFEEDAETPAGDATIHWVTTDVLQRAQSAIAQLDKILTTLKGLPTATAPLGELAKELDGVLATARSFGMEGQRGEIHRRRLADAANILRQYESQTHLRRIAAQANQALNRTEASASKASEAAGVTSESVMAAHYKALADAESTTAGIFRMWTIISTIFAGATAGAFLLGPSFGWAAVAIAPNDWVHLIQRAIITAAVFAFAAYLARQAHQHRSMANWAGSLAVQLKTFEAFLAPIASEEVRDQLRMSFATRAFGDHPAIKGEPSGGGASALTEKAIDLLAKNSGK